MNYTKLQEMQRALDDSIIKEKELNLSAEYRFELTCHAFLVELSEIANSSEYFKFWKTNKGKVDEKRFGKTFVLGEDDENRWQYTDRANQELVSEEIAQHRTLVEEVSDCLHFLLSLANQSRADLENGQYVILKHRSSLSAYYFDVVDSLMEVMNERDPYNQVYEDTEFVFRLERDFRAYYTKLGITQEELEQAYYDKNKVNYERLRSDY
jgi:dimeric dUTPase (all-alpha-NTP-PPase superfamily)